MKKNIQVSASVLCADFANLGDEIKKCENAGIDSIHVDVMDGQFVPNISIGSVIVTAIRPVTKLPIEVHLMIESPGRYINDFISAGADIISIHVECYGVRRDHCCKADQYPKEVDSIDVEKALKDINLIKENGKKVYLAVNPGTPLCFDQLLSHLDGVLIMSVNPGFAKQKFMPSIVPKIKALRESFAGDISVDGGVNDLTAPETVKAGANILASASYFFGSQDPQKSVQTLKSLK